MTEISTETSEKTRQKLGYVEHLNELKENWPSPFVSRDRIEEFTQGLFKRSSMNTFDARGDGINKRYRRGSKIFYEVDDVIEWLKTKIKIRGEQK